MGVSLEVNGKKHQKAHQKLTDIGRWFRGRARKRFLKIAEQEYKQHIRRVNADLAKRHSSAWPDGTTTNTLSQRSGRLRRALLRSPRSRLKGDIVEVSFKLPAYARIQEYGGVIRPKRAKYLTVPLPPALTSRGLPIKPNARAWKNTFVYKSRRGKLLIARRVKGGIENLYVLKKRVRIKPRLGLRKEINKRSYAFVSRVAKRIHKELLP